MVAFAGLIAIFGGAAIDFAAFFALQPHWGSALSALAIGVANFVIAFVLIAFAKGLKPGPVTEMIKEVRDMAIEEIEQEGVTAKDEMVALKDEAQRVIKHPVEALAPSMLTPLLSKLLKAARKKSRSKEKDA